jgi:hypothetical protein
LDVSPENGLYRAAGKGKPFLASAERSQPLDQAIHVLRILVEPKAHAQP